RRCCRNRRARLLRRLCLPSSVFLLPPLRSAGAAPVLSRVLRLLWPERVHQQRIRVSQPVPLPSLGPPRLGPSWLGRPRWASSPSLIEPRRSPTNVREQRFGREAGVNAP